MKPFISELMRAMPLSRLREMMNTIYHWTDKIDYTRNDALARVWYVSEEKLEPRLGERFDEPIEPYEQPLAPGRDAVLAMIKIDEWLAKNENKNSVAQFLLQHPEHRHIVRRAQTVSKLEYAEIQDNTISASMQPIDLLRCKLSFFGASKFDPRSDRWLRSPCIKEPHFRMNWPAWIQMHCVTRQLLTAIT